MIDQPSLRAACVAEALAHVGLHPNDPEYASYLYPFDPPAVARQMATRQSGCGLRCEAGLRAVQVADPRLYLPYGPRSTGHGLPAVALQKQIALENQAWNDVTAFDAAPDAPGTSYPQEGDMVLQGQGGGGSAWFRTPYPFEHVWTLTSWDDDGVGFWSVDGGEPDIEKKHKQFFASDDGQLWVGAFGTPADGAGKPVHGVRVVGWLDIANMPFAAGAW